MTGVCERPYSTSHESSHVLSLLWPRNRAVSRKLVYLVLGIVTIFILAAGSVKTHVVDVKLPKLDTSRWIQSLQGWWKAEVAEGPRKAIILASYQAQNVSWLIELNSDVTSGWEIYRYVGDAPASSRTKDILTVQNPDGREALPYLTYIIDHFSSLPEYNVFIHGHERAWHQPASMVDRLSALNLTAVNSEGYVSLSCHGGGCDSKTKFYFDGTGDPEDHRRGTRIQDFWDDMMMPRGFGPLPAVIGRQCCAQFAVHRDAILRHDLKFWREMRKPFLTGPKHKKPSWLGPLESGHKIGLIYEMLWHIFFGKDAVHCPSFEVCENEHFQGLIHCDRRIKGWDDKDEWENIKCTNDLRKEAPR